VGSSRNDASRAEPDLAKENARLRTLVEINQRLHTSLDVDQVLSTIVDVATQSLGAERSTLYVVDPDSGEIWSRIVQGDNVQEIRLKIGEGIAGYVAQTGQTVNLADVHGDERFHSGVDARTGFRTGSMLCMPLELSDGNRVGVIQVMNKRVGVFTEDDEEYLSALCVQAALSLQNAQHVANLSALSRRNQDLVEVLERRLQDLQELKMISMQNLGEVDAEELSYLVEEGLPATLGGILEGSEGIAEIVKRIRGFVRLDQGPVQFTDLNEDMENVIKVCSSDIKEAGVTVQKRFGALPRVECRPSEINMVLRELLRNAIYYASRGDGSPASGRVLVRTDVVDEGSYVEMSILDNGPGIPREAWKHIFDLFYTTKPEGSGYGLGLSECYAVVKRNGGTLSVEELLEEDAADYRTRVVLRLPTRRE